MHLQKNGANRLSPVVSTEMEKVEDHRNICLFVNNQPIMNVIEVIIVFNHQPSFSFYQEVFDIVR